MKFQVQPEGNLKLNFRFWVQPGPELIHLKISDSGQVWIVSEVKYSGSLQNRVELLRVEPEILVQLSGQYQVRPKIRYWFRSDGIRNRSAPVLSDKANEAFSEPHFCFG